MTFDEYKAKYPVQQSSAGQWFVDDRPESAKRLDEPEDFAYCDTADEAYRKNYQEWLIADEIASRIFAAMRLLERGRPGPIRMPLMA